MSTPPEVNPRWYGCKDPGCGQGLVGNRTDVGGQQFGLKVLIPLSSSLP